MQQRNQRRPGISLRIAIIGIGTLIAVGFALLGPVTQLYPSEVRQWLDPLLKGDRGQTIVAGVIGTLFLLWWIAEMLRQSSPLDAPPMVLSGTSDLPPVTHLTGDLESFKRQEGFIDAARSSEIVTLTQILTKSARDPFWVHTLRRLTFGRAYAKQQPQHIALLTGIGGIGKTSLSKRIAHDATLKRRYPDGQYYFNFNGLYVEHHKDDTPKSIGRLLRAVWPAERERLAAIEASEDANLKREQYIQQYRAYLADQRLLIILDDPPERVDLNAFLPPPQCGLLLVARPGHAGFRRLTGYQQQKLEPLSDASAIKLIEHEWTTGFDSVIAKALAHLCSNVPLALVVIGKTLQDGTNNQGTGFAHQLLTELQAEHAKKIGLRARFFRRFVEISGDQSERQTIDQVLRLSYNLLVPLAQQLFRGLAIFETHAFSSDLAQAVCFTPSTHDILKAQEVFARPHSVLWHTYSGRSTDPAEAQELFEQIVARGLIARRQVEPNQPVRYELYDLMFFYARSELENENHKKEIAPLRERYMAWVTNYTAMLADQLRAMEATPLATIPASFASEGDHMLVAYATLTDNRISQVPDEQVRLSPDVRDCWLLKLVGPGLVVLSDERLQRINALAPLCNTVRVDHWRTAGQAALVRTLDRMNPTLRACFAHLGVFHTWFDLKDAHLIMDVTADQLNQLVTWGLVREQGTRYLFDWPFLVEAVHQTYQAMPTPKRMQIERRYADRYAQRLRIEGLTDQIADHVERGQSYAVAADPPMPHAVITYADKCYWHFKRRREYARLRRWLTEAIKAASQTRNDTVASLAHTRLGDICVDDHDADQSQAACYTQAAQHYYRALTEFPNAADDIRAWACLSLGNVAERQGNLAQAAQHYRPVLTEFPHATENTRASACQGLGNVALEGNELVLAAQHYYRALTEFPNAAEGTRALAYIGMGNVAFRGNELAQATQHYQRVLSEFPHTAEDTRALAYIGMGNVAGRQDNLAQAEHHYYRALTEFSHTAEGTRALAYIGMGNVAERQGKLAQATQHYQRVLTEFSHANENTRALAYIGIGNVAERQGNLALAEQHYQRVLAEFPHANESTRTSACLSLGNIASVHNELEQAAQHYQRVLAEFPNADEYTRASACLSLGNVALRGNELAQATQHYQRVLTEFPNADEDIRASACHGLGIVAFMGNELVLAAQHYQRVLTEFPNANEGTRVRIYIGMGNVTERQGNLALAEQHYQRVLSEFPNADEDIRASACLSMGNVAERQGNLALAEQHYQRVLSEFPNVDESTRASAYQGLGNVALRGNELEQAAQHYQRVLVAFKANELEQAAQHYQRALTSLSVPHADEDIRAMACLGLGVVAEQRGDLTEAAKNYQRVLNEFPTAAEDTRARACKGLGLVAFQRNELAQAAEHYQRVLTKFPNADDATRAMACLDLGLVAFQRNELAQAAEHYQRVLNEFPTAAEETRANARRGLEAVAQANAARAAGRDGAGRL